MIKKSRLILIGACFFSQFGFAQSNQKLNDFNAERNLINKRGMLLLGGWSLANIAGSAYAYSTTESEVDKSFYKMNLYWGGINLLLATSSYLGAIKVQKDCDLVASIKQQQSIEKTFLLNAGLDLAYVAGGMYLNEKGKNDPARGETLRGFGKSVVLQGAFLLCFDTGMFIVHNHHGNKGIFKFLESVKMSGSGMKLQFKI